jgi:hypothetical protein
LLVRGIAGGITSGVTNFGIVLGSSVPPGIGTANARGMPKRNGAKSVAPANALYCTKRRRVMLVITPPSLAVTVAAPSSGIVLRAEPPLRRRTR